MPLKCLRGEEEIYAFNIESDEAWEDLRKANAKAKDLRMPCCHAGVVLRTSKLGTKHFAHARIESCQTAPETAEHLLAKMAVLEAIKKTDWTPLPEQAGNTPSGEEWRADVLAVKGKAKVAFEIQWSRQDKAETIRRQKRYDEAGVRGLWLFRQKDFPIGKETPAFRLVFEPETKTFRILLPSPHYHPEWAGRTKEDAHHWGQSIPLATFVAGALKGQLRFAPALGLILPLEVSTVEIQCWRCKEMTGIIIGLNFVASRILPGCPDIPTTIYKLAEQLPKGNEVVMAMLPARLLNSHGIGAIRPRYSKTASRAYMSNGCVHCDAIQGRFYEHDFAYDGKTAFEIEVEFKAEWGPALTSAKSFIDRWWFNESNPQTE
jgi:competence protein CoiA